MESEKPVIAFSFDRLNILGIFGAFLFIEGNINYYDEKCIIKVKKPLFHKTLKEWMKEKQQYCEHFKGFCGVNNTETYDYEEAGETEIYDLDNNIDPDEEPKTIKVKIYKANSLDTECEHG